MRGGHQLSRTLGQQGFRHLGAQLVGLRAGGCRRRFDSPPTIAA